MRDHLANERTYLAWLRTSLAVVALGAVLTRLPGSRRAEVIAASVVAVVSALGALAYGTRRYYLVRDELEREEFTPAGAGPLVIAIAAVVMSAVILALLLV